MHNSRCYIVLRTDLNMPEGKAAVQVGHAIDTIWSHYIINNEVGNKQKVADFNEWVHAGRKKVVLKTETVDKMNILIDKIKAEGHEVYAIEDNGVNFFDGLTTTGFVVYPVLDIVKSLKRIRVW